MGDGIMATFGAAVTSPTYAADALKTIDDIMIAAAAWGEELRQEGKPLLKMGAAVATGKIIFGAVGPPSLKNIPNLKASGHFAPLLPLTLPPARAIIPRRR
jgi:hypothetical protein